MGLPAQGQKKDDGKKRFCCRSFPYVVSKMGGGCFFRSLMAQKNKHKLDEEENFDFSNHQKFMRHKMRQKREEWLYPCLEDGRRMMRRTPKKKNKTKKNTTKPGNKITALNPPWPQSKAKTKKAKILSNPAAGSKSIQKRDVHMCITGEKKTNKMQQKRNQHHVMQLFIRLKAGQGMRI